MTFPTEYRERLFSTLSTIDTALVAQAIGWMKEARDSKHALFVAGNGGMRGYGSAVCRLRYGQGS